MSTPPTSHSGSISPDPDLGKIAYVYGPSDWFSFRHSDWRRMRERAGTLADKGNWVGPLGWAAVGVVAAGVLGLFPWLAEYSQLPTTARLKYGWITGAFIAAAGVSAVLALVCLLIAHTMHKHDKASLKSVLADMDDCYGRAATPTNFEDQKFNVFDPRYQQVLRNFLEVATAEDSRRMRTSTGLSFRLHDDKPT